jgi:mono/diheme cytochrome c family protein
MGSSIGQRLSASARSRAARSATLVALSLSIGACAFVATTAACSAQTESGTPAKDPYARSLRIFQFRKAAPSGIERGQEIFYYKCWFCHNEFVADVPHIKGLYQRPALLSGEPVSDETVKQRIRNGGPGMAAYKYTLSEADIDDLVSYLRERCCWDSESPPPNPQYHAQ